MYRPGAPQSHTPKPHHLSRVLHCCPGFSLLSLSIENRIFHLRPTLFQPPRANKDLCCYFLTRVGYIILWSPQVVSVFHPSRDQTCTATAVRQMVFEPEDFESWGPYSLSINIDRRTRKRGFWRPPPWPRSPAPVFVKGGVRRTTVFRGPGFMNFEGASCQQDLALHHQHSARLFLAVLACPQAGSEKCAEKDCHFHYCQALQVVSQYLFANLWSSRPNETRPA